VLSILAPETRLAERVDPCGTVDAFGVTPDPRMAHDSGGFLDALQQVSEALRRGEGLILVTGEPGTGKTLLCRALVSRFANHMLPSVVLDPCVSCEELLMQILRDFGVLGNRTTPPTRHELMATLQRFLISLIPTKARAVVIIDEAQHLDPALLEQIRLLSNYESDDAKLLQIVLVGTSALDDLCGTPAMRHFAQRVSRRCRLRPLSPDEVKVYVHHRLSAVAEKPGWRVDLRGGTVDWDDGAASPAIEFTPAALQAIATLSGGIPRVINRLCSRTLDISAERGVHSIDGRIVRAAARQCDIAVSHPLWSQWRTGVAAAFIMVGLAPATWLWASQAGRAQPQIVAHAAAGGAARTTGTGGVPPVGERLTSVEGASVLVASFRSVSRARAVAAQLQEADLPAFADVGPDGAWHVVRVGPYLTDDEARAAQRTLAARGFTVTRVVSTASAGGQVEGAAVASVGSRVSLVLELPGEPRDVSTERVNGTVLDVDAGPITAPIAARAFQGASLVDGVVMQGITNADGSHVLHARVTFSQEARSRVRLVGHRLYIDLIGQEDAPEPSRRELRADADVPRADVLRGGNPRVAPAAADPSAEDAAYRDAIDAVVDRFEQAEPFLLSAAAAPRPDVLQALTGTLGALRESVAALDPPRSMRGTHGLLLSAVTLASAAVEPSFQGDRDAKIRQALAVFAAGKAQLQS